MTDGIFLIMSGAYVEQELAAEFGNLPPAFLPVGNHRLHELQLSELREISDIFLTIPEDYKIPERDLRVLDDAGVSILALPPDLTLGEASVYAINYIGKSDRPVRILHGDTLVVGMPLREVDIVATCQDANAYRWAEVIADGEHIIRLETPLPGQTKETAQPVACGYFAFSSGMELVRAITRARGRFIEGINIYAQERPLRPAPVKSWYDFGHLQTLFHSRRAVTTARAFNTLRIDSKSARKSAADAKHYSKIRAEAEWLRNVPASVQVFAARILDAGETSEGPYYVTEYEYMPTLSELFVFGAISQASWRRIIGSCEDFLSACAGATYDARADESLAALAVDKTVTRLEEFARSTGFNLNRPLRFEGRPLPSLLQIAEDLFTVLRRESERRQCVMHGDFCFSNILFNFRTRRIRVLDPRGLLPDQTPSIYGDLRYDLAKLSHSVFGRYDQIIAGRYTETGADQYRFEIAFEHAQHHAWVEDAFAGLDIDGVRADGMEVRAIMTGLFLSMLPLHDDRPDRQRAFIANAVRLYAALESVPA